MTAELFVVPDLDGRPTGGTRYNAGLVGALRQTRATVLAVPLELAQEALDKQRSGRIWIDSLYLHSVPEVRRLCGAHTELGLLLHYLPSLVASGTAGSLSSIERAALSNADWVLVTSRYMQRALSELGFDSRKTLAVEPGVETTAVAHPPSPELGLSALLIAHVVHNKGIEPLLRALARELTVDDRFELKVAGAEDAEPEYAQRCRRLVSAEPQLKGRVRFLGVLEAAALSGELAGSNLSISASRMESYGMALAEARGAGLPILARAGGNVSEHVRPEAGGELVRDETELARACVALGRDPVEHARRLACARALRPLPRSWSKVASEFSAAIARRSRPKPAGLSSE